MRDKTCLLIVGAAMLLGAVSSASAYEERWNGIGISGIQTIHYKGHLYTFIGGTYNGGWIRDITCGDEDRFDSGTLHGSAAYVWTLQEGDDYFKIDTLYFEITPFMGTVTSIVGSKPTGTDYPRTGSGSMHATCFSTFEQMSFECYFAWEGVFHYPTLVYTPPITATIDFTATSPADLEMDFTATLARIYYAE